MTVPASARNRWRFEQHRGKDLSRFAAQRRAWSCEWHTFWNEADDPARMLELISPGGLEEAFKIVGTAAEDADLRPPWRRPLPLLF